jgi:hypothetical protein
MDPWPVLDKVPERLEALWRHQRGWRAESLVQDDWIVQLQSTLAEAIGAVAAAAVAKGMTPAQAVRGWSPPPAAISLQNHVEELLEGGIGIVLLRGLQPHADDAVNVIAILLLSSLFGRPVSQTKQGNLVARIEDLGLDFHDPRVRGHQTSAELTFHCDRADRVMLYCIRKAKSGGKSRVVSSITVANILQEEYPTLAQRLFDRLPQDRRGEQSEDQLPWTMLPVFSVSDGIFVARYLRRFITDSQRHPGAPSLGEVAHAALARLDEVTERPGLALDMSFRPGDVQIINNNVVLHSRTAFVDHQDVGGRRLLLRVWTSHRSSRPLPKAFGDLYGLVDAGVYRGGVWPDGVFPTDAETEASRTPACAGKQKSAFDDK